MLRQIKQNYYITANIITLMKYLFLYIFKIIKYN